MNLFDLMQKLDDLPYQIKVNYHDGMYWLEGESEQFGQIHLDRLEEVTLSDYVYETICQLEVDLDEHSEIAYTNVRQKIEQAYDLFNQFNKEINKK